MNLLDGLFAIWILIACIGCFYLGRANFLENHINFKGADIKKFKMSSQGHNILTVNFVLTITLSFLIGIKGARSDFPYVEIIIVTAIAVVASQKAGILFEQGIFQIRKFQHRAGL